MLRQLTNRYHFYRTPKPKNNTIRLRHYSSGPTHDPYAVQELNVYRNGVWHTIESCGLRGCRYSRSTWGMDQVIVDWEFDGIEALESFTEATGAHPGDWERWYYRDYEEDPMGSLADYE